MKFDIVVCGGGISGAIAAISAARCGCSVLLADKWGFLGGMLTGGGVGPMMTFHAGNKLVVRGITNELIERMAAKGKSPGHILDTTSYTYTVTPFDAEAMKGELETMFTEAGGTILYHAMAARVKVTEGLIESLTFTVKGGEVTVEADVFIDATGDADLAVLCGVPCQKGMKETEICQPLTMNMKVSNVDMERVRTYIKTHPEEFPRVVDDLMIVDRADRLSIGGFVKTLAAAQATGEIDFEREDVLFFETNNPGEVIVNTSRMKEFDPTDPWQLSQAEIAGRQQAYALEKFLIRHIPGFEKARLIASGPSQVGVRSSRQIKGEYVLTHQDLLSGKRFPDVIAHGGYHIDVHQPKGGYDREVQSVFENDGNEVPWGHIYQVPYRSLINPVVKNLIAVGRCISTSFIAQGAIRVSPIAGAIGHGGGAAAAVAVRTKRLPYDVDVRAVQKILLKQNAFLDLDDI